MPDGGLQLDDLTECVRAVLALRKDLDAISIAEAIWLAAKPVDAEEASPGALSAPGTPATDAAQHTAGNAQEEERKPTPPRPGRRRPDIGLPMPGRRVQVAAARPFPEQLELARSLRPFKRPWPRGRRMKLDIDATVRSYSRAGHLVPTFGPTPERWFEVAFLVDDSPSMALWAEETAGLSQVLAQVGMFRAVRRFRLLPGGTDGPSGRPPSILTEGNRPFGADQLRAPDGRRLIIIVTDGTAPGWRQAPAWKLVRSWAASTPTVLISPLATRLWGYTGLDLPAVRTGPGAPGSPNPLLKFSVPLHVQAPGQSLREWLPVPAMTLVPDRLSRWARTLMRNDPIGCEALLVPETGRADVPEIDSDWPPDEESVSTFLRLASPQAARLAVLCSLLPEVSLPLLRLLREELVPAASTGDLAEVMVGGLFQLSDSASDGAVLRMRDGARQALLDVVTGSDAWRVYDMLDRHIPSTGRASGTVPAIVPDPRGDVALPAELLPFAGASRYVLELLGVSVGTEPIPLEEPEQGEVITDVPEEPRHPVGQVIVGNIPQVPSAFQPRADLLHILDSARPGVKTIYAIGGMRGVGKTQLAAAHARNKIDAGWSLVAWVNAEDSGVLLAGLAEVADRLGLPASATIEQAGMQVRQWLEANGASCLIVFDNITDMEALRRYLPATGHAQVLITSNRASAEALGMPVLVDVFTVDEAVSYLTARTGLKDTSGARSLAAELGFLPLALSLASAQIAMLHLSYQTYLERLRSLPLQEHLRRVAGAPYPHGLAETVLLSLDELAADDRGTLATTIMETMSLLSEAGTPRDLLIEVVGAGAASRQPRTVPPTDVDRTLGQLAERSLLAFSRDQQSVSVHRLVMRVVRESLIQRGRLTGAIDVAVSGLLTRSRVLPTRSDRTAIRAIPEQVAALLSHVGDAYEANHDLTARVLELRSWAMYYLSELGDSWPQAITFGKPLAEDLERILGPDHPDTLAALSNLANAYGAVGDIYRAIDLYARTVSTRDQTLGPNNPDTLLSRGNLASAYRTVGRTSEAISLYEQTLDGLMRVYGPTHPRVLATQNNLAITYLDAGRIADAIPLLESALTGQEQRLGSQHPETLNSLNNLAASYQAIGDLDRALPLLERASREREAILGPDHPDTLASLNNMAYALTAMGRFAEALPLLQRAVVARERLLGPRHPDTLSSLNNLAIDYQRMGRISEAIPLFEQVLTGRMEVFGPDHPYTLTSQNNLGSAYQEAGRMEEAVRLYEAAYVAMDRVLGPDHPDTRLSRDNLSRARAYG